MITWVNDEWIEFGDFDDLSDIEPEVANNPRVKLADDIRRAKQGLQVINCDCHELAYHQGRNEERLEQQKVEEKRDEELVSGGGEDNYVGHEQKPMGERMKPRWIEVRNDDPEWPHWLPKNWRFTKTIRENGMTKGVTDKFYINPQGRKFRSKKRALEFLEKQRVKHNAYRTMPEIIYILE